METDESKMDFFFIKQRVGEIFQNTYVKQGSQLARETDFDLMFGFWTLVTQERFLDLYRFAENPEAMMAQNYKNT